MHVLYWLTTSWSLPVKQVQYGHQIREERRLQWPITEKALKIYEDNTNSNYKSYNYIRAHSCHLRTGNSSYTSHGLVKIVQQKIGNTFLIFMTLDFWLRYLDCNLAQPMWKHGSILRCIVWFKLLVFQSPDLNLIVHRWDVEEFHTFHGCAADRPVISVHALRNADAL